MIAEHLLQSSLRQLFLHLQRLARAEPLRDVCVYSIERDGEEIVHVESIHLAWGEDDQRAEMTLEAEGGAVEVWRPAGPRSDHIQRPLDFIVEEDGYRVAGGRFETAHHAATALVELFQVAVGVAEGSEPPTEWTAARSG
ncbi:MAG: hypothetical protein ACRELV_02225 [Longimicrobiales bacterium]